MIIAKNTSNPLTAREFINIQLPDEYDLTSINGLQEFRNQILLQGQGESACLSGDYSASQTVAAFGALYGAAQEIAVRRPNGALIRIFLHTDAPFSYFEEIDNSVWEKIQEINQSTVPIDEIAGAKSELLIDCEMIWQKNTAQKVGPALIEFLDNLKPALSSAAVITVSGDIPAAALAAVLYVCRPLAKEVVYFNKNEDLMIPVFM